MGRGDWRPCPGAGHNGGFPVSVKPMPDYMPRVAEPHRTLMLEAAQLITQFRRKLNEAGYPFREPPLCDRILAGIDAACFVDEKTKTTKARSE